MRSIVKVHNASYAPIADLVTYRALPTASIDHIDPFLFLNHHGPQVYTPNNRGLPFGPHPHRGFETVTLVIDGDIYHKDSSGNEGTILPGGVQWMTAGSGLIHSEISSANFKRQGGKLEILQLWVNLAARHKMTKPAYVDLQKEQIPVVEVADGKADVQVISGNWNTTEGAYRSLGDIHLSLIRMKEGASMTYAVAPERNVFFYVIKGGLLVNGTSVKQMQLVEFSNDDSEILCESAGDSTVLFGHALPFNEPIVAQGPFVMNNQAEIMQAYKDFRAGKMGTWQD